MAPAPPDRALEPNAGPAEYSGTAPALEAGGAPSTRRGAEEPPPAPPPPCGAPEAWVGSPLNEATGLVPDEETEMPAPGEIWLEALSRLLPAPRPVSISLSSDTTS